MKKTALVLLAAGALSAAQAQVRLGEGQLSGSFETNTIYYVNDDGLGLAGKAPEDRFGTNNYLKVDYSRGRFSAGVQMNAYLPALQGYEIGTYGGNTFYLASKYVQWKDENYSFLVGDIFDQYGNGLIYRSYEDRQLGFNNSIEGVRAAYNFGRYFAVKGMYGRPRLYADYAGSWVRGADATLSLAPIFCVDDMLLNLEASYVNRYESLTKDPNLDLASLISTPNLNMWSGRLDFGYKGVSLRAEYAHKSKDLPSNMAIEAVEGDAVFGELGFNIGGFSFSGQFRTLKNMATMLTYYGDGTGNVLNYLPALTRQYTYMLANLNPYQVNAEGEIGGQVDAYYSLRSKKDRYKYWNFHVNYSTFYTLMKEQTASGEREQLWQDFNVDVERQWDRRWKTSLLFSYQEWNPNHGYTHRTYVSNIFVADITCKIDKKNSLRLEAQYLLSDEWEGDWVAGLLEYSFAPRWSVFVQDMYNIDKMPANGYESVNYYSGGFSYTKNRTRVQLSYGRNRAGFVCSGGVCRYQPAYTGVNLVLTSSF